MKNIFGYFLLLTNWFGSRDHMQQCQQQMVSFLEREREQVHNFMSLETSGMQILPAKNVNFMNLVCFTQISPSFILLGDLLYKSTHKDFVLSLHKTLYKWSRIEEKGKLLRNCRTIGRIYRYISSLLCQGLFES